MSKVWKRGLALVLCVAVAFGLFVVNKSATPTMAENKPDDEYCCTHFWVPLTVGKYQCTYPGCGAYLDTPEEAVSHGFTVHDGEGSYTSVNVKIGWRCDDCGEISYDLDTSHLPIGSEHVWGEGTLTIDPSCTKPGIMTYTCANCHETKTEEVDALGHDYSGTVTTAPGCETNGVMTYTCSRCGDSYTEAIPATGHSFSAWTESKAPTCTEEGQETRTCATCGKVEIQPLRLWGTITVRGLR